MAGEDARVKAGLKSAEDELNLIKNQIQQTLLDIREHILDVTNPFNNIAPQMVDDEMSIADSGMVGGDAAGSDGASGDSGAEEEADDPAVAEEDVEMPGDELDDVEDIAEEPLVGGDSIVEDQYEEIPDEIISSGGGSAGGSLAEMLSGEADEQEDEPESEEFELDDVESPELDEDIEEDDQMEQPLPGDELLDGSAMGAGDQVAEAVAAALAADVDLLTMASLVRWTAITRERIGANRLDILLDAYEMAGRISPQMKNVVRTLSALGDEDEDGIPVRDVVTAMVRMEGVINTEGSRGSNRLLGLLLEMDDDPLDHLAA